MALSAQCRAGAGRATAKQVLSRSDTMIIIKSYFNLFNLFINNNIIFKYFNNLLYKLYNNIKSKDISLNIKKNNSIYNI